MTEILLFLAALFLVSWILEIFRNQRAFRLRVQENDRREKFLRDHPEMKRTLAIAEIDDELGIR